MNQIKSYILKYKTKKDLFSLIEDNDEIFLSYLLDNIQLKNKYCININGCLVFKKEEFIKDFFSDKQTYQQHKNDILISDLKEKNTKNLSGIYYNKTNDNIKINSLLEEKIFHNTEIFNEKNQNNNFIFKGNNLIILSNLKSKYKNQIDGIYIDPPYYFNKTKNKNLFKYNSNFNLISWMIFLKNRLEIAKELLSQSGIIFISINEDGYSHLKTVCNDVFNEINFLGTCIWENNAGTNNTHNLTINHEYVLIYCKNIKKAKLKGLNKDLSLYKNPDNDPNGEWKTGDPTKPDYEVEYDFEITNPITGQIDKCNKYNSWRFPKSTYLEMLKEIGTQHNRNIGIGFYNDIKPNRRGFFLKRYKDRLLSGKQKPFSSILFNNNNQKILTGLGKKDLEKLQLHTDFPYAKPVELIKLLLNQINNSNATILDFFGGSGTTGQAVLELNKEDNGNRQFILIEQLEYAKTLTTERIKKYIDKNNLNTGFTYSELLGHDLNSYISISEITKYKPSLTKDDRQINEILYNIKL